MKTHSEGCDVLTICYISSVVKHTIIDFSSLLFIFGSKVVNDTNLAPLAPNIPYGKCV